MATECQRCGAQVSRKFARVFGDNDDTVHACTNCVPDSAILNGAAHNPEVLDRDRHETA